MRVSSCLVTHSAVAILATALLCGLSGTATSQARLPSVTIDAPKQMARPHRLAARPPQRPQVASTSAYRPLPPNPAPGTVMARFAEFENIAARANSSCADGCQSSFPSGNRPWVGCSASAWPMPSAGCRNPRHFKTYVACTETSYFLAWKPMETWWYCSALALNK